MIAGPPSFQRDKPTKAELAKIKTLNESVNRPNQIIVGYIVLKCRWEQTALAPINPPPRSLTSSAPDPPIHAQNHSIGWTFHTAWAKCRLMLRSKLRLVFD